VEAAMNKQTPKKSPLKKPTVKTGVRAGDPNEMHELAMSAIRAIKG
jgi:hypothetical protein